MTALGRAMRALQSFDRHPLPHLPIDPARRLHLAAYAALIGTTLDTPAPGQRHAALRFIETAIAAGLAQTNTLPDGRAAIRLFGISGISGAGPAPLLHDWRDQALTALAQEERP